MSPFIGINWYVNDYCDYLRKYYRVQRRKTLDSLQKSQSVEKLNLQKEAQNG